MASNARKVLVPIANGTKPMEAVITVDVLRRTGADVTFASAGNQLRVEALYGLKIVADASVSDVADTVFDLIILPAFAKKKKYMCREVFRVFKILENVEL